MFISSQTSRVLFHTPDTIVALTIGLCLLLLFNNVLLTVISIKGVMSRQIHWIRLLVRWVN